MAGASSDCEDSLDEDDLLSVGEKLLKYSRNGKHLRIDQLLTATENFKLYINCKGTSKANRDWTPLHLSSYFGHMSTVELLIKNGADINAVNDKRDTPLHKAAYTGRLDVVTLLLKNDADVNIVNVEGKTALKMAKGEEVHNLIKAAHETENVQLEKSFLQHASEGNIEGVEEMIKECKLLNINCVDSVGNSALHLAAYRDQQKMAAFLMQAGIKSDIRNKNGLLASDVASSQGMSLVLNLTPLNELCKNVTRFEGALYKQTRLFGFKPKYVVLDNGVLSVFSTRADASSGAKRRTFKYLDDAHCLVQSKDNLGLAVVYNNGSTHRFRVESASDSSENISRQKWVNAIRNHIGYSTYYIHKGMTADDSGTFEELLPLSSMSDALQMVEWERSQWEHVKITPEMEEQTVAAVDTAQAYQTALEKEVNQLILLAGNLTTTAAPKEQGYHDAISKCANISNDSRDMCSVLQHCLTLFTQQEQLRSQQLSEERERCRVLQESLRVLAVQHHVLEQQFESSGGYTSPPDDMGDDSSLDSSEDEFYDCDVMESGHTESTIYQSLDTGVDLPMSVTQNGASMKKTILSKVKAIQKRRWTGRSELPVPMRSRSEFSVWSILKQCIGKELSKITMPVVFNEPISFLQRITEYMEYSYLLERASVCETPEERMAYISAFAVSACASNWDRLGKPFNPLLGETYELNKEELGYKVVCEQVSHHPPVSAFHVSADDFLVYGAINPKLKFWGKSVEITPKGVVTVELLRHGEVYTWENVNCAVHNIIVGKLWVEHHGRMEITNHKTGHKAELGFKKSNIFSKDVHRVEGYIINSRNEKVLMLYGSWTDAMFSVPPKQWEKQVKTGKDKSKPPLDMMKSIGKTLSFDANSSDEEETPNRSSDFDLRLPNQTFLWQADHRPESCDKYYSFTSFAMMLNELDESQKSKLCPTDSRLRPDIRSLELGNIDQAAEEKVYLEEKQRNARKDMKKNKEDWSPRWFSWTTHPVTGQSDWIYQNKYWEADWTNCPDIY